MYLNVDWYKRYKQLKYNENRRKKRKKYGTATHTKDALIRCVKCKVPKKRELMQENTCKDCIEKV